MKDKINFIQIAYRNLGRHKLKSFITISAVTFTVFLYVFIDAYTMGISIQLEQGMVNFESSAAKIYKKEYYAHKDDMLLYESFNDYNKIIKKLNDNGYSAAPHAKFTGTVLSSNKEVPLMIIGINPQLEKEVFKTYKYIQKGDYLKDNEFEILIGNITAHDLDVKVNDVVQLKTVIDKKDETGKIKHIHQVINLKVCGIIRTPNPSINSNFGFVPLDILQDSYGMMLEGNITELCIRKKGANEQSMTTRMETPDVINKVLSDTLPQDLVIISWKKDAKDLIAQGVVNKTVYMIIIIILILLSTLGITNTMVIAIMQRTKEIGVLRSMGMFDWEILKLFMYESGLIGLISSVAGIILSVGINFYMVNVGFDMTQSIETYGNLAGKSYILRSAWNMKAIIFSFIFPAIFCSLLSIIPTIKTLRHSIVNALRLD